VFKDSSSLAFQLVLLHIFSDELAVQPSFIGFERFDMNSSLNYLARSFSPGSFFLLI